MELSPTRTLILSLVLATALHAQSPKSKQSEVDRIFASFNTHTPGCAVAVSHQGTVVARAGYGMADLERNVPITPETVFESGSVAKQFTATALLLLAQQGKISLDDPMRKYLPELPDYGTPLTIRHVLSHLSGLREWRLIAAMAGMAEGTRVISNQDLLLLASKQRALNFDPGTAYCYTNTGFNIGTIVVERALANGKSFQEFTREQIFEPLKMVHTRWRDNFRSVVPGRALAYDSVRGGWIQATPIENIIGAGGMLSTVDDWLLWNENFTHAKVGGQELLRALQTPATLSNGRTIAYAAGLTIETTDGLREISHGGATGGYRTWLARYPDQGVSVAVMCNSAQANPAQLGRETARLWTGGVTAPKPAAIPMDESKLRSLSGMYRKVRDNTVVLLEVKNGKLVFDGRVGLIPIDSGQFSAGERRFEFEAGRFREMTRNGDTLYERVEPANLSEPDLAALAGRYESSETDSMLTVAVKGGELTVAIASNEPIRLRPTFRDAFIMRDRGGTAIRFLRDASGNVSGLSAGDDRVWDLRFARVK